MKYSLKYLYNGADQVTVTIEDSATARCIAEQKLLQSMKLENSKASGM